MNRYLAIAFIALAPIAQSATAAPFPETQKTVATSLGYQSTAYTIAANSQQTAILIPVANRPVQMMVATTTPGDQSLGSVTIMRATGDNNNFLVWDGYDFESTDRNTGSDDGISSSPGSIVMFADEYSNVTVQVESYARVLIANSNNFPVTVVVTFMY